MKTMQKKLYRIIGIGCLSIFLLLSGCTSNENTGNDNQPDLTDDDTTQDDQDFTPDEPSDGAFTLPIYPDVSTPPYPSESLWTDAHVDNSLEKNMYLSGDQVEEIFNYYKFYDGDWEIRRPYLIKDPDDQSTFIQGELLFKHGDNGAYLLIMSAKDLPVEAESIICIAQGNWTLVQECGMAAGQDPLGIGEGSIVFTLMPIKETDYYAITPLGSVKGADHTFPTDHGGFIWNNPDSYPPSYDVVAPAYGLITEIRYSRLPWPSGSGQTGYYNDYRVRIDHTNSFRSLIGHISELDESLLAQTGALTEGDNKFFDNPITIEKGEIIGKTGGRPGAQTGLIWWVIDEDITLDYVNPDRYNQFANASHFIPYCTEDLQSLLTPKLGGAEPYYYKRTAEPLYGKVDFDVSGKLVGNWFEETINQDDPMAEYEKHLSFVYSMWDPTVVWVGIGGTLGITATVYTVEGTVSDPADVTRDSGQIVYHLQGTQEFSQESLQATLLVEMVDDEKIKVEGFAGWVNTPSFTGNAIYYIR